MGRLKDTEWTCRSCNVVFDESSVGGWFDLSWPRCRSCLAEDTRLHQERHRYDRNCTKCGTRFTPDNPHDGRHRQAWCQTCLAHEEVDEGYFVMCSECGEELSFVPHLRRAACLDCDRVIRAG